MPSFYSTLVRLKETVFVPSFASQNGFYSTLVRLKVSHELCLRYYRQFLFHIGAIKSGVVASECGDGGVSFYSTLVRLKVKDLPKPETDIACFYSTLVRLKDFDGCYQRQDCQVSIPHWCD